MIRVVACLLLVQATSALASPVVPAYERFHAGNPPSPAAGRLLITELSCTACHTASPEAGLPAKKGPVLDGIATRVSSDWLRQFLANPQQAKPGTTMPDLLAGVPAADRKEAVESLVHLLASLSKPLGKPEKLAGNVSADRGMLLYHEVGCVSCHAPDPAFKPSAGAQPSPHAATAAKSPAESTVNPAAPKAVPLPDLKAKYSLESLARFLRSPLDHRPAGRMPDLLLDMQEAVDLAGYLIRWDDVKSSTAPKVQPIKPDPKRVADGRKLFASLGCAACHTLEGVANTASAKPLLDLKAFDSGCLSAAPAAKVPHGDVPHFAVTPAQAKAISLAATTKSPDQPADRVVATLKQLNCYACHQRDDLGGIDKAHEPFYTGDPDLADEGRFPPRLTGVGRKLTPQWLTKVLGREGRLRPYLRMRMPVFAADAVRHLPADLIATDGGMKDDPAKALAGGDMEAGRQLLGGGGLSCITCHGLNGRPSIGIHALDLTGTTDRLQPAFFRQNLLNPAGVRPGTLMPTFWPEGKAANGDILHGDTEKQIASIWAYLKDGKTPIDGYPPAKGEFELVAEDRPVILRCFMQAAGTHAIAVGFPQKVHLAFDAASVRPAIAWRGKFLDAYTTWFSRNQPPVDPLGDAVVSLPAVMPLAKLGSPEAAWPAATGADAGYTFRGYRLDKQGIPTFLYTIGELAVEDRITPTDDGKGLFRQFTLQGNADGIYFNPAPTAGLTVKVVGNTGPSTPAGKLLAVRSQDGKATLTVEYRW